MEVTRNDVNKIYNLVIYYLKKILNSISIDRYNSSYILILVICRHD